MWMLQETLLQNFVKFGGNLKKNAAWFYYSTLQVYEQSYSQVRHIPPKMSDQFESQHSLSPTIWSDILVGRESGY